MIELEELPVDGAPQVGITVTATAAVVSVEMSWDGATWHPIASSPRSQRVEVDGAEFFRHFTPPLNVETSYRVVVHSGSLDGADTAAILVASDVAWVQDPLDPRSAVQVLVDEQRGGLVATAASFQGISRPQAVDVASVSGSRVPVAAVGTRQAPAGFPLQLKTFAAAQGELVRSLRDLFDQAGAVVMRGLPLEVGLDPVVHVVAPDLQESPYLRRLSQGFEYRLWEMTLTQVRGPGLRVVIPWFTYEQVTAWWQDAIPDATYDDVIAARPGESYIDWTKDPEP